VEFVPKNSYAKLFYDSGANDDGFDELLLKLYFIFTVHEPCIITFIFQRHEL